jgi:hypothetical protein
MGGRVVIVLSIRHLTKGVSGIYEELSGNMVDSVTIGLSAEIGLSGVQTLHLSYDALL